MTSPDPPALSNIEKAEEEEEVKNRRKPAAIHFPRVCVEKSVVNKKRKKKKMLGHCEFVMDPSSFPRLGYTWLVSPSPPSSPHTNTGDTKDPYRRCWLQHLSLFFVVFEKLFSFSFFIDLNPEKSIEHELVKVTKCLGANNIKIPDDNVSDVYIYARRQVGLFFSLLLAVDAEWPDGRLWSCNFQFLT